MNAELEARLRKLLPVLQERFGVKRIGVFGSYARGSATSRSDIDLLVEFSRPIGWEFIDLKEFLEAELGLKVDLVSVKALKPRLRKQILREVVYL